MKKLLVAVLALTVALSSTAQEHKRQGGKERKIERKDQTVKHFRGAQLAKKLDLSHDQRTRIQAANESYRERIKELNTQDNITVKEQKERRSALAKEHKESIQSILTAEQQKQLEETKKDGVKNKEGERVEQLDRRLDLTDAQGQKIKEVNQDFRTKLQDVQRNESLTKEQKRDQIKTLQQSHTEQIKSILTEEQKNKLEALKRNKSDRRTGK